MKEEMLDIYDDAGQRIGVKPYAEVHRDGNWHRVVGLFVINSRKEILMQRRSRKKSISPGLLTVSVGGHLRTGEDEYYCMKREMREEMGIELDVGPAQLLYACQDSKISRDKTDNVFLAGYTLHGDIDLSTLKYDKDEVEEFLYISCKELQRMFDEGVELGINRQVMTALFRYMKDIQ